jgi:cell division protein FtsL
VALTLAVGVFFLILFGVALLQTALVQGQLHLDGLQADVAERQTEAQRLRYLVSEGGSPDNIRRLATERGMGPKPQQFVRSDPLTEPVTP